MNNDTHFPVIVLIINMPNNMNNKYMYVKEKRQQIKTFENTLDRALTALQEKSKIFETSTKRSLISRFSFILWCLIYFI